MPIHNELVVDVFFDSSSSLTHKVVSHDYIGDVSENVGRFRVGVLIVDTDKEI